MHEIYRKFNFAFTKITETIKDIFLLEYLVKSDKQNDKVKNKLFLALVKIL